MNCKARGVVPLQRVQPMMIDILMAATVTRLDLNNPSRPPDLSPADRLRFALGLIGFALLYVVLRMHW
ncbi:MAG: hypothetical protein ACK4G5_05110 [Devosia sp.]|jgi:hypothetical protein